MGETSTLINLILLAVAVGVFLKLRSVLGRRTGSERPPFDPYSAGGKTAPGRAPHSDNDKVVQLPKRGPVAIGNDTRGGAEPYPQHQPEAADRWAGVAPEGSAIAQTLTEIALADRHFDGEAFMSGARAAYEMIVSAFARGERKTLQPLLAAHVFKSFDEVIAGREARGETVDQSFIGIDKAELVGAELNAGQAKLTIRFVSELISCTKTGDGVVVEGDPVTVRKVTDVWTFERNVKANDPNWRLTATGAEG